MKIALLQSSNEGFFPRYYHNLKMAVENNGDEIVAFLPRSGLNIRTVTEGQIIWGSRYNWLIHYSLYKIIGICEIWSLFSTLDLLHKLSRFGPDVLHLNVINEWNLCFPLLVRFIRRNSLKVVWTLHDCRAFTARCANFEQSGCMQWIEGCKKCSVHSLYEPSLFNNVSVQWYLKRRWYSKLKDLTVVTPSQWLAEIVEKSILQGHKSYIIHNGIDTSAFSKSTQSKLPQLEQRQRKTVLGVSMFWEPRKGLDTIIWLCKALPEDYRIVIVGNISHEYENIIPNRLIVIPAISDTDYLSSVYQSADVFINPTLADNFPTVNIEALGAGIPVVTYKTGGSAECLDEGTGMVVEKNDYEAFREAIIEVCSKPLKYTKAKCIERSQCFSLKQFDKYLGVYYEEE